jgi:hypothetical protein
MAARTFYINDKFVVYNLPQDLFLELDLTRTTKVSYTV